MDNTDFFAREREYAVMANNAIAASQPRASEPGDDFIDPPQPWGGSRDRFAEARAGNTAHDIAEEARAARKGQCPVSVGDWIAWVPADGDLARRMQFIDGWYYAQVTDTDAWDSRGTLEVASLYWGLVTGEQWLFETVGHWSGRGFHVAPFDALPDGPAWEEPARKKGPPRGSILGASWVKED